MSSFLLLQWFLILIEKVLNLERRTDAFLQDCALSKIQITIFNIYCFDDLDNLNDNKHVPLSSNDRLSNISQGKFHRTITKTLVTFPQFRLIMPMGWPCDLTAIVFGCLEYFLFHGIC